MVAQLKLVAGSPNGYPLKQLQKGTAVSILKGDPVSLTNGLAVVAPSAATKAAVAAEDAPVGTTTVQVYNNAENEYYVTASAAFAATDRGVSYNMLNTAGVITLNKALTAAPLFNVTPGVEAGTVGATTNVRVTVNPL